MALIGHAVDAGECPLAVPTDRLIAPSRCYDLPISLGRRSTCRQLRRKFPSQFPKMGLTSFQVVHRSPNRRSLQTPTVNRCNGKKAKPTILRRDTLYADVATHIRPRSATAPMHKLALTAPKRQSARPILRRQRIRRSGPCPSRCEALVRGRPFLRSEWKSMESGCTHGRSGNSVDVSSPSASLSRGSPSRLQQSRRNNDRGGFASLDRRSGGKLQRADLAARRHLADVSRRLSVRSPQPYNYLPMWRITEQAVLRWQPRIDQIQGGDNR